MEANTNCYANLEAQLKHTVLRELGDLFCKHTGTLDYSHLQIGEFRVAELLAAGWIVKPPGRWMTGFMPGPEVVAQMWTIHPELCDLLGYEKPTQAKEGV